MFDNSIYNSNGNMLQSQRSDTLTHLDNCTDGNAIRSTALMAENLRKGEPVYSLYPLTAYIDDWLNTYKKDAVKQSTYDRLLTSRIALEKYPIAAMPIGAITAKHIQEYVNELTYEGYALTTILKQKRIVTAPLKHAAALHYIPSDPTYGVNNPSRTNVKKAPRDVQAYSQTEQQILCSYLESYEKPAYPAAALMMETGLRIGETLSLKWSDVDIHRKRLKVQATVVRLANKKQSYVQNDPKTLSSRRTVPLTPKAIQILQRLYDDRQKNEWVFNNTDGDRLSYEAARYQIKTLCDKINIPFYGTHVFRHTFATNCYHKGINVKILSRLLGHADVNVTYNTYIHLYGDGFDEMYAALVQNA